MSSESLLTQFAHTRTDTFLSFTITAMVSRAHDEKNKTVGTMKKSQCASDALSLALLCGAVSTLVLFIFGNAFLQMMYTPHELITPALSYLYIRALALPATLVTTVGTATSLGSRDSKTPLFVASVTGTLNVLINLFLVLGPPQLGIVGSAIGTCLSQNLGAVLFYAHMTHKKRGADRLTLRLRFPNTKTAAPFVASGAVLTTRSVCVMSSYSLATASAASMGTLTVASHQVLMGIMTVAQFAPEPLSSCAQSNLASTQVAIHGRSEDSFGKKKHGETEKTQDLSSKSLSISEKKYAKEACQLLLWCGFWSGLLLATGTYVLLTHGSSLFSSDTHVVLSTSAMAPILAPCVFVYATVCVTDGLLFASGRVFFAAGASVLNLPVVAFLISYSTNGGFGLVGTWLSLLAIFGVRLVQNLCVVSKDYGLVEFSVPFFRKSLFHVSDNTQPKPRRRNLV
jgi:Na+-driven multidrug efflux pump